MNINFESIRAELASSGFNNLPKPAVNACKLSAEEYAKIYQMLSHSDQNTFRSAWLNASEEIRLIYDFKQKWDSGELTNEPTTLINHLYSLAIQNLKIVRLYQLSASYFDLTKMAKFSKISHDERWDVIAMVESVADELPAATQKEELFHILRKLAPEERRNTLRSAINLAQICYDERNVVELLQVLKMPAVMRVGHLKQVDKILNLLHDIGDQRSLLHEIHANMQRVIGPVQPFLRDSFAFSFEELLQLLHVVNNFLNHPASLQAAELLVARCQDGTRVAAIIQDVAKLRFFQRDATVQQALNQLPEQCSSEQVHQVLLDCTPERPPTQIQFVVPPNNHFIRMIEALAIMRLAHGAEPEVDFEVAREDFVNCPTKVLRNLVDFFEDTHCSSFTVRFLNEDAVDQGGPARDFLHNLVAAVCKELRFETLANGLFRPKESNIRENAQSYSDIAQVFMFCLHSNANYRIGMQLDKSVFTALALLEQRHLELDITKLGEDEEVFQAFFPIYKAMKAHNEDDRVALARMEESLDDPDTKAVLVEAMQLLITPCMAFWSSMRSSHYQVALDGLSADDFEKLIQGTVNAEAIINQVRFGHGITEEMQGWIKKWIESLDQDLPKMKKFLAVLTGAPGLGPKPILIDRADDVTAVNTCDQMLRLPALETEQEVIDELDKAIEELHLFTAP